MQPLLLLRILGIVIAIGILLWGFSRYRSNLIHRSRFLWLSLFGIATLVVSVYPDSINTLADMMALRGEAYGRLIALLIVSNMVLWLWFLGSLVGRDKRDRQFDMLVRRIASESLETGEDPRAGIRPVTIIIPAWNEADNLRELLPRIPQQVCGRGLGVLVVDDGSTDGTSEVAKALGCASVRNPMNRGSGAALRLGFDLAMAGGGEIVVTLDADGQHRPEEVENLVRPILEDRYDFVIGSRVLGSREKDSAVRILGVHLFSRIINLLAGTRISDCSSGYRALKVDTVQELLILQDQYYAAEAIIDAAKKGVRIGEVPISILKRKYGQSKKGRNLSYGLRFSRTILKTWWR